MYRNKLMIKTNLDWTFENVTDFVAPYLLDSHNKGFTKVSHNTDFGSAAITNWTKDYRRSKKSTN